MSMAREPSLPPSPVGRLLDGFFLPPSLLLRPSAGSGHHPGISTHVPVYAAQGLTLDLSSLSSFGSTFEYRKLLSVVNVRLSKDNLLGQ